MEGTPVSNQNTSSVIFVCWGNICRSPMAEFVARKVFANEAWTLASPAPVSAMRNTAARWIREPGPS